MSPRRTRLPAPCASGRISTSSNVRPRICCRRSRRRGRRRRRGQAHYHDAMRQLCAARRATRDRARLRLRELAQAESVRRWCHRRAGSPTRFAPAISRRSVQCSRSGRSWRTFDRAESDEHKALHVAVLHQQPAMVRLLMRHGADARRGIWPHRDATAALTIAEERGYDEIAAIILDEERRRNRPAALLGLETSRTSSRPTTPATKTPSSPSSRTSPSSSA